MRAMLTYAIRSETNAAFSILTPFRMLRACARIERDHAWRTMTRILDTLSVNGKNGMRLRTVVRYHQTGKRSIGQSEITAPVRRARCSPGRLYRMPVKRSAIA